VSHDVVQIDAARCDPGRLEQVYWFNERSQGVGDSEEP
jgi:hypothetical protein